MNQEKTFWAVILGGSSGLGLATAKKLANEGFNICLVHRDRKTHMAVLDQDLAEMRKMGVEVVSVNKSALMPATIAEVMAYLPEKSVKVLVHSIAKGSLKPLISSENNNLTQEDINITIQAMGLSWLEWTRALITENKFADRAANLAFTSEGNTKVMKHYGAVSLAKATLESLMRQMAVEFAAYNIQSNCIQAGVTDTSSFRMIPGSSIIADFSRKRNPYGRLTTPEDVANAVYLLTRDEANWINGNVIKADGGESLC